MSNMLKTLVLISGFGFSLVGNSFGATQDDCNKIFAKDLSFCEKMATTVKNDEALFAQSSTKGEQIKPDFWAKRIVESYPKLAISIADVYKKGLDNKISVVNGKTSKYIKDVESINKKTQYEIKSIKIAADKKTADLNAKRQTELDVIEADYKKKKDIYKEANKKLQDGYSKAKTSQEKKDALSKKSKEGPALDKVYQQDVAAYMLAVKELNKKYSERDSIFKEKSDKIKALEEKSKAAVAVLANPYNKDINKQNNKIVEDMKKAAASINAVQAVTKVDGNSGLSPKVK